MDHITQDRKEQYPFFSPTHRLPFDRLLPQGTITVENLCCGIVTIRAVCGDIIAMGGELMITIATLIHS